MDERRKRPADAGSPQIAAFLHTRNNFFKNSNLKKSSSNIGMKE